MRRSPRGLGLLLVLSMLLNTQGLLMVQGAFQMHRDYIADHLCENRFDPSSDCDGLCYLRKNMDQEHQRHDDETATPSVLVDWHVPQSQTRLIAPHEHTRRACSPDEHDTGRHLTDDIFHPPKHA